MSMSRRENYLRAVEMREPEWMPSGVFWPRAVWHKYREKLEDLIMRHPLIFGNYQRGSVDFDGFGLEVKGKSALDEWGCVWHFLVNGLAGQVVKHPLEDWSNFDSFKPPKPTGKKLNLYYSYPSNWNEIRVNIKKARKQGLLTEGHAPHGFMFQRLYYLRGFKNLMVDMVTEHPRLSDLISMVLDYNLKMIEKWLEIGVDVMVFGDDLGTQDRLTISPKAFRKYLAPAYTEMFMRVRESGTHVYLHSDGHIMEIAKDLIQAGVTILNPQDKVNRIDNITEKCKGQVCVDLDIDRQKLLPFGTPKDIEEHIKEAIMKLGSKEGGLMLKADCYPDVPLENIEALCTSLEKYQRYYSGKRK